MSDDREPLGVSEQVGKGILRGAALAIGVALSPATGGLSLLGAVGGCAADALLGKKKGKKSEKD